MKREHTKHKVMFLTGITADDYHLHIFESGMDFISFYCKGNEHGITAMSQTSFFWDWYEAQFYFIDEVYVACMKSREHDKQIGLRLWHNRHRPDEMPNYPDDTVLKPATKKMFQLHEGGVEL